VSSTNTEDSSLISDHGATELGYVEVILEVDFVGRLFLNIKEVNVLGTPFKVMDKFA
jgi:hypothetical protein